jgi:murein L,D-transpeptidase YcbB/YkuD
MQIDRWLNTEQLWIAIRRDGVKASVKPRSRAGKTLLLALLILSISACGSGFPFGGRKADGSALQSAVNDPQARAFYQSRQWKNAWDKKSEKALLAIIANAPANGLKPDLFLKQPLPRDSAGREAALTAAALRYASALARGYSDPTKISPVYTIPRPNPDLANGLAAALAKGDLEQWYASLPPQTDEYRALSEAHLRYLRQAAAVHLDPVAAGKPIKPGQRDARLPAIATALAAIGYLPASFAPQQRYTRALVAAVKRLQSDWSIKSDGVIGGTTLDAINLGPAGLAREIAINMERLRWLERDPPATRIDVNTAATLLDYWRDGQHIDHRNVVAGEPDKQTPQIQASFAQLVANPKWRVPDTIAAKELADKSPGWLQQNDFAVENGRYIQQSGPKNSLGQVKLDVEDPQQIYLHDTPAKALFGLPERHRSHGCVRVQNALQFAAMLTSEDGVVDDFQEALASGDESYVKLKTRIPVRLLYHTVFFDGHRVQFRPDVYGWDDDVAMALGLVRGGPRQPWQQQGGDIGP